MTNFLTNAEHSNTVAYQIFKAMRELICSVGSLEEKVLELHSTSALPGLLQTIIKQSQIVATTCESFRSEQCRLADRITGHSDWANDTRRQARELAKDFERLVEKAQRHISEAQKMLKIAQIYEDSITYSRESL